jgi:hypothetical protein
MSTGYDLGVDLYELWHAGKNLIPDVAEQFHLAYGDLQAGNDSGPWYRGNGIGVGGQYGCHSEFQALMSTLDGHIAQTYNNLYFTGQALVEAANNYDLVDGEAGAEFTRRKQAMGEDG